MQGEALQGAGCGEVTLCRRDLGTVHAYGLDRDVVPITSGAGKESRISIHRILCSFWMTMIPETFFKTLLILLAS
jgi:hypothetical protein